MRTILFAPALFLFASQVSAGDLDGFLSGLNVQARADLNGFTAKVGLQFGIPAVQVRAVLGRVQDPADAFMVFQLGQMARLPHDQVLDVYKTHKHRGWGEMAKALGIKPGSPEFHALKAGKLRFDGRREERDEDRGKDHGKGQGRGKGHGKDKHG